MRCRLGDLAFNTGDEFVVLARATANIWKASRRRRSRKQARIVDLAWLFNENTVAHRGVFSRRARTRARSVDFSRDGEHERKRTSRTNVYKHLAICLQM
jgi:hypothetical protein